MLLSSGDSFPHLIQKRRSQLGFVTYLLNCPRTSDSYSEESDIKYHQGGLLVICFVLQFIQIFYLRIGLDYSELLSNHSPTATRAACSAEITSLNRK
jgi:NADH:ubiquinone oxidoreductase subunit 2 (subunit N)